MRSLILSFTFLTLAGCTTADQHAPVALAEALAAHGRTGYVQLSETYRGDLQEVYRTGIAVGLDPSKPETLEFNHIDYQDRGMGSMSKPVFTIMEGGRDTYTAPATYDKDLPSLETVKTLKTVGDFEKVFGESRGFSDAQPGEDGTRSSLNWMAFSMQPDGSLRVVEVFLFTLIRGNDTSIEGETISEGIFKPTGKSSSGE